MNRGCKKRSGRFNWQQKQKLKIVLIIAGLLMWSLAALMPGDGWGVILVPTAYSLFCHIGLALSTELTMFDARDILVAFMAIAGEVLLFVGLFMRNDSNKRPATSRAHEAMLQIIIGSLLGVPIIGLSAFLVIFLSLFAGIGIILAAVILPEGIAGILLLARGVGAMQRVYQEPNEDINNKKSQKSRNKSG